MCLDVGGSTTAVREKPAAQYESMAGFLTTTIREMLVSGGAGFIIWQIYSTEVWQMCTSNNLCVEINLSQVSFFCCCIFGKCWVFCGLLCVEVRNTLLVAKVVEEQGWVNFACGVKKENFSIDEFGKLQSNEWVTSEPLDQKFYDVASHLSPIASRTVQLKQKSCFIPLKRVGDVVEWISDSFVRSPSNWGVLQLFLGWHQALFR